MKKNNHIRIGVCLLITLLMMSAVPTMAGGPLIVFDAATQTPFAWPGFCPMFTDNDPFYSLTGPVSNADQDARCADGIAEWSGVATATFTGGVIGDFASIGLPDITLANFGLVIGVFNGGGYHVIYDHDGSLTAALAGPGVLGFSGPEFATAGTPDLLESFAVLNGSTVDIGDVLGTAWQGVTTHEFGHGINLAHTQLNGGVGFFGDDIGPGGCPTPYDGFPLFVSDLETMYPFLDPSIGGTGVAQGTVDRLDDTAALSDIYPAAGWPAAFGTISGTIFLSDGATEVTGVNVIARNVASPFTDAISQLSGAFTQGDLGPDGRYALNGLTPGAEYVVYVDAIIAGGFSTPPTVPLPGPEEFWNGASESSDGSTDDVCDFTSIFPAAGSPTTADIVFNTGIFLGDDDFEEVALPFTFRFCGQDYTSVFVGSNGFLTFGEGDTDFSESVSDLLDSPPRIAPMWDDLNPSQGGTITAEEVAGNFVITYTGIPEFLATGANTFAVTLRPDGSFNYDYGAISASDGLVGHSPGAGAFTGDPGEIDVTAAAEPITGAAGDAVYELFSAGDNDLAGDNLEWAACPDFEVVLAPADPDVCYGSTGASDGGRLITIDVTNGAGALVGPSGLSGVPGLAINSSGQIFGTERISGDLYRLDAATGAGLLVGSTGVPFMDAIAFDENDVLYGIGFDPPDFTLWIIDTGDASITPVGPTGDIYVGLAFDPTDGQLYASVGGFLPITADGIARIDKTNGTAVVIGTTGLGGATPDLHFDKLGNLYGSKGGGFVSNDLISVDKSDGSGAVIGSIGFTAVSGLATFIEPPIVANLDIKPGSCPNPFNLNLFELGQGMMSLKAVLPVAVVGSATFDVADIDFASLLLEGVAPIAQGGAPKIDDVATPVDEFVDCACTDENGDGIDDLKMKFSAQEIAAAITPGMHGDEVVLTLTGQLLDGTPFEAQDCIRFVGQDGNDPGNNGVGAPAETALRSAYPNPFNPVTRISYVLKKGGDVSLSVYDVSGKLVARLVKGVKPAGEHAVVWDARGTSSGVYFYRLTAGSYTETRKMILLK